jgi:hypothetical protein
MVPYRRPVAGANRNQMSSIEGGAPRKDKSDGLGRSDSVKAETIKDETDVSYLGRYFSPKKGASVDGLEERLLSERRGFENDAQNIPAMQETARSKVILLFVKSCLEIFGFLVFCGGVISVANAFGFSAASGAGSAIVDLLTVFSQISSPVLMAMVAFYFATNNKN